MANDAVVDPLGTVKEAGTDASIIVELREITCPVDPAFDVSVILPVLELPPITLGGVSTMLLID